ncbi:MAG: nucleoside-diphosphate-sugar epimerase [Planctomycetota bacterium]|jgi:nucleoside-diphosphate-sugar epimerase
MLAWRIRSFNRAVYQNSKGPRRSWVVSSYHALMAFYLVTGGAGFIGSHITTALLGRGDRVRILDNLSSGTVDNFIGTEIGELGSGAPIELLVGDIKDASACKKACDGVHGVFHEAAQVSVPRSVEAPEESYAVNVTGTLNVLEGARAGGAKQVVFAASSAAYGESESLPKIETMHTDPVSPYASGKVAAEQLMKVWGRCYGLKTVCLRYFNVFGPRQVDDSPYTGVIALFVRALLEGRAPRIYGDGEQTRDMTYIDNVVEINLRAMSADLAAGTVINVGGGQRITINQLYGAIAEGLGSNLKPEYVPERPGDVKHSLASVEKAKVLLDWAPGTDWRAGLAQTLVWYRERFEAAGKK